MRLVLCQLYPAHLSIYADRGNVQVLRQRCAWRGIELVERPLELGGTLEPDGADLYLIGGGQDRDQVLVAEDLQRQRDALHAAVADGAAVLAVCGGYQMLGHRYLGHQGDEILGIGLVDLETLAGEQRMIGNILCTCDLDDGTGPASWSGSRTTPAARCSGRASRRWPGSWPGTATTASPATRASARDGSSARTSTARCCRRTPGSPTG